MAIDGKITTSITTGFVAPFMQRSHSRVVRATRTDSREYCSAVWASFSLAAFMVMSTYTWTPWPAMAQQLWIRGMIDI